LCLESREGGWSADMGMGTSYYCQEFAFGVKAVGRAGGRTGGQGNWGYGILACTNLLLTAKEGSAKE
jgi:hypothetical protein